MTPAFVTTRMNMQQTVPTTQSVPTTQMESTTTTLPLQGIFGPLGKQYCAWFYFLSLIGFIMVVLLLVSGLYIGISKRKGLEYYYYLIMGSVAYLIVYFQNRLLYNMCAKTL